MQFLKDTGFVIKRTNVGEADKFITLYTQNSGKVEVLGKGVRQIKSRRGGSIDLLNLVKFNAVKTRVNFILTDVEVLNTYEYIKNDYASIQVVFLVCELLNALCPLGEVNTNVFILLHKTFKNMDPNHMSRDTFEFQVKLLESLGFWNIKNTMNSDQELKNYIESIIEKKVKTKLYFEN